MNWGLTKDPQMHEGKLDFDFLFDVGAYDAHCTLGDTLHDYYFQDFGEKYT